MDQNTDQFQEDCIKIPSLRVEKEGRSLLDTPEIELERNRVYAITGPSGAGKTLFLFELFFEKNVFSAEHAQFFLLQEPGAGLTPHLKIRDHVEDIAKLKALPECERPEELVTFSNRFPASLSGGERQRVMASLILGQNPELLACDEPVANLSQEHSKLLFSTMMEARRQRPFTLLFVSHQWKWIEEFADFILYFQDGRITHRVERSDLDRIPAYQLWKKICQKGISERNTSNEEQTACLPGAKPKANMGTPKSSKKDDEKGRVREALISVEGLTHRYAEKPTFKKLSWSAEPGEWWWILGPNGSGKTTLGKILAGLRRPEQGKLFWRMESIPFRNQSIPFHHLPVQYVFQQGLYLFNPRLSLARQLTSFFRANPESLHILMEQAGLRSGILKQLPHTLSLGEKQRFNLIRALAGRPELLIADETMASLDMMSRVRIIEFLKTYQQEHHTAVLMMTHDPEDCKLNPGRVLRFGAPQPL